MLLTMLLQAILDTRTILEVGDFQQTKTQSSIWLTSTLFLSVFVLLIVFWIILKKKQKSKAFLKAHVNKKMNVAWNLLTNTKVDYKAINTLDQFANSQTNLIALIACFEENFLNNKEIRNTTTPNAVLFNLNSSLQLVKKVQYSLNTMDIRDIDNSSIKMYGKPSVKDLQQINELYDRIQDFKSNTAHIHLFDALKSKANNYVDLEEVKLDLNYVIEHKKDLATLINANKTLIESLRPYFD